MKVLFAIAFAAFAVLMYVQGDVANTTHRPIVKCPEENYENATLLPNPYNCNTYFACESGTPIPMKCPKGLHFNAKLSVCDWPRNAKCKEIKP